MKRLLLNLVTALSLLLLMATVGLWVRSYWYADRIGNYVLWADSQRGTANFVRQTWSPPPVSALPWVWDSAPMARRDISLRELRGGNLRQWSALGVQGGSLSIPTAGFSTTLKRSYLIVPYWMFCLLESLLPAAWLIHRLRPRRHGVGLCPTCSYDLRAHLPISELSTQNSELPPRCPECGTPIPPLPEAHP